MIGWTGNHWEARSTHGLPLRVDFISAFETLAPGVCAGPYRFTSAVAQRFDATQLRQPCSLGDAKWLVNAGDDPAFADPAYDDSHWPLFDPHKSIDALYQQLPPVIWYRLHVKVDPVGNRLDPK